MSKQSDRATCGAFNLLVVMLLSKSKLCMECSRYGGNSGRGARDSKGSIVQNTARTTVHPPWSLWIQEIDQKKVSHAAREFAKKTDKRSGQVKGRSYIHKEPRRPLFQLGHALAVEHLNCTLHVGGLQADPRPDTQPPKRPPIFPHAPNSNTLVR